MRISFYADAFDDYNDWAQADKKVFNKIKELIKDVIRNPFKGIGKPEPLKKELQGFWSRRITDEHRLIYKVRDDEVIIVACKYHYK